MKYTAELTEEEKAEILKLRAQGRWGKMDPRKIGRALDISEDRVRIFLGLRLNHTRQPYKKSPVVYRWDIGEIKGKIPEFVLAERDRRLSIEHHSIGAALLGDPLPGYSALDRRNGKNQTTA